MGTLDDNVGILKAQSKNRIYILSSVSSSFHSWGNKAKDTPGLAQCHSQLVANLRLEFSGTQTSIQWWQEGLLMVAQAGSSKIFWKFLHVEEVIRNDQTMGKWHTSWVFGAHHVGFSDSVDFTHCLSNKFSCRLQERTINWSLPQAGCFLTTKKVNIQPGHHFSSEICEHWLILWSLFPSVKFSCCEKHTHLPPFWQLIKLPNCWWKTSGESSCSVSHSLIIDF